MLYELIAQRVPVRGEPGIGYMLESGFDMPPLMLTPDEIEAVVLSALGGRPRRQRWRGRPTTWSPRSARDSAAHHYPNGLSTLTAPRNRRSR